MGVSPRCCLEYAVKMICAQADVLCQQFEAGRGFRAFDQATGGSDLLGVLFDERCLVRLAAFAGAESWFFRVFAGRVKLHIFGLGKTRRT